MGLLWIRGPRIRERVNMESDTVIDIIKNFFLEFVDELNTWLIERQLAHKLKPRKRPKILQCTCCEAKQEIVKREKIEETTEQWLKIRQHAFVFDQNGNLIEIACPRCGKLLEEIKEEIRLENCSFKEKPPVEICLLCDNYDKEICSNNELAITRLKQKLKIERN